MKIAIKIFIVIVSLVVFGCFLMFWVQPDFSLWQMDTSIILKKQNLPLMKMITVPHERAPFEVKLTQPKFVLAGPFETLIQGTYTYNLEITPDCDNQDMGFMDVARKKGKMGAGAKEVVGLKKGEKQLETLKFEAATDLDYEFRFYSNGSCPFEINNGYLEKVKVDYRSIASNIWRNVKKIVR
jgi:hypothetical protein